MKPRYTCLPRYSAERQAEAQELIDLRGIDRSQGALVVVRPDQYIAHVLPLTAHAALAGFFAGFMLPV